VKTLEITTRLLRIARRFGCPSNFHRIAYWGSCLAWLTSLGAVGTLARAADDVLNFALLDHRGRMHELRRMPNDVVVLFFTANECPVARQSAAKLRDLQERWASRGVGVYLVNANSADDRKSINKETRELGIWHLPTLKDDTQGVARHLNVKRTGETIAINPKNGSVIYRGAIDDQLAEGASKPAATEHYLDSALENFLAGRPVQPAQTAARGCVIHFEGGAGPNSTPVNYAGEVAPILQAKCVSCHSPGNIGQWAMSSHRKVKGMAGMIEEVLLTHRMPPWDADPHLSKSPRMACSTTVTSRCGPAIPTRHG